MALPVQPAELKNPAITLNDQTLTLPITMKSGDYLELEPSGVCMHYRDNGSLLARVRPAATTAWPILQSGSNVVTFDCERPQGVSARAEVTLNALGVSFGAMNPRRQIGWSHLAREYEMTRTIIAPVSVDNAWDVAVRPSQKAVLEFELCGAMESPVLTVCGRALHFPVTLKSGQRLVCRDQRHWMVMDAAHAKIAEGQLAEEPPVLKGGLNRVEFTCARTDGAQVKLIKVYR
jgi:hypothetical protein